MLTVVPINPDAIVLLMCSLHVAPAIWQAIKSKPRLSTATGKLDVTKFVLAAISALLGIALLCYKVTSKFFLANEKRSLLDFLYVKSK